MSKQLIFDIETIPDIEGARRLYNLHGLSDEDVAHAIFQQQRQQANSECLRHPLHKIIAISAVLASGNQFRLWSLGAEDSSEQDLLRRFYAGLDRYSPHLLSWNGNAFSLPVIHYRSLLYPLNAASYWGSGEQGVYHQRHSDLMVALSGHHAGAAVTLNEIATLCGFPGKVERTHRQIWQSWLAGDIAEIRQQCEISALNIYLLAVNWQRNRGERTPQQYLQHCDQIRAQLKASEQPHLIEFERNWIELQES